MSCLYQFVVFVMLDVVVELFCCQVWVSVNSTNSNTCYMYTCLCVVMLLSVGSSLYAIALC